MLLRLANTWAPQTAPSVSCNFSTILSGRALMSERAPIQGARELVWTSIHVWVVGDIVGDHNNSEGNLVAEDGFYQPVPRSGKDAVFFALFSMWTAAVTTANIAVAMRNCQVWLSEKQVVFCWSIEGVHIGRAWEGAKRAPKQV